MAKVTAEMVAAIKAGTESVTSIATSAGVSRQAVFQIMKKYSASEPVAPAAPAKAAKSEPKKSKKAPGEIPESQRLPESVPA
jgi:transposase-like protein